MKKTLQLFILFILFSSITAISQTNKSIQKKGITNTTPKTGDYRSVSDLQEAEILKLTQFYGGDSLTGFDYNFFLAESKVENIKIVLELRNFMFIKQSAFVKQKYNLTKLPYEIAKEDYLSKLPKNTNAKVAASACNNIDFEDGNLGGWLCSSGYNTNSNAPLTVPGAGVGAAIIGVNQSIYSCSDINVITGAYGLDPIGFPGLDPSGATTSARLGGFYSNQSANYGSCSSFYWSSTFSNGQEMSKSILVGAGNSLLSYDYAVVLNDGGHTTGNQPYFHVVVTNTAGVVLSTCTQYYVQAPAGSPPIGFLNSGYVNSSDGSIVYYKSWTSNSINLTPYIGQTVNIKFSAAGCTAGLHNSWAYVDAICGSSAIIASNSSPCVGQSVTLTAPAVSGGSYMWTGTGVSGQTTQNVSITSTGTYTVVVTPSQGAGCAYTLTKTVTFNALPIASISSSPSSSLCLGSSVTITAGTASTYTWTGSSGNGLSSTSGSPVSATPTATGSINYMVNMTAANGCTNTIIQSIFVNPVPVANAGLTNTLTCANTTLTLSGSGGGTYLWSGPGIVSGGTSATPIVSAAGSYSLTVTSAAGCTSPMTTVAISQNTTSPTVVSAVSGSLNCTVLNVNLSATTISSPVTYNWTGTGITSATNISTITVNQAGTFNYTVTNTSNGCKTIGSLAVIQNTTAPIVTSANTGSLNCTTLSVNASATTTSSPVSYNWSGTGITSATNISTITVNQGGTFNFTVTNTNNNCIATGFQTIIQNTVSPNVVSASTGSLNCILLNINVSATTTTSPVTYNWTGTGITSATNISTITVNQGGTFNYTVTNTSNNCKTVGIQTVTQNTITPVTAAGTTGSITCNPSNTITLTSSLSGMSYTWTAPGGSFIASGTNLQNAIGQGLGTYTIFVLNPSTGCTFQTTAAAIQNTTAPTGVSAGSNQTITCSSSSVTLTGSATGPAGTTANWLGGVSGSATSFVTTASSAGIFTLQAISPITGCITTSTVQVFASAGFPSVTASPVTNSITCTNTLVPISISSTSTPISILWSGSGITGSTTTPSTTVSLGGTYTVVVTNTLSMCSTTLNIIVPSNTTAVNATATIAPTTSITCTTTSLTLNASPAGSPYTILWSGSGIVSGGTTANPIINSGGMYTVTITNTITGCSGTTGTAIVTIPTNTTAPTLTVSPANYTITCSTPTVQLTSTSTSGPLTYTWIAGGGSLSSTSISNPIANGGGIYSLTITNTANGCTSTANATVTPDSNAPIPTISPITGTITCNTSSISAIVTVTNTAAINLTYSWTPTPLTGVTTATASFGLPGTYICSITNTVNGCPASISIAISSNTVAPSVTITPSQTLTCGSTTVAITTTVSPSVGISYNWSGAGIVGSNTGSSIVANSSGIYSVTILNASTGCSVVTTTTVQSNNSAPSLSVAASGSTITCITPTLSLNASSNSTSTLIWATPTGTASNPIIANISGNYTVTITDAITGCSNSTVITVYGTTLAPVPTVAASILIPCGSNSVTLSATSSPGVTYLWAGPNVISGGTTSSPLIGQTGIYTVVVTSTLTGCSSSATVSVNQGSVTAAFIADPTTGVSPLTVNFTNQSIGAITFNWTFGNGNTSTNQNPNTIYNTNGTFTVMLIASSGSCSDTAYATIIINDGLSLEIPNVFTPNGDGTNDLFHIKSTGIKEISLQIFNRWGEKLYEFSGPKAEWDGINSNGNKVADGTYFYFVKAIGFDGKEIEKHGTVNLFR